MQNQDRLYCPVHHLVHRTLVEEPVHQIMVMFHEAKNIRIAAIDKVHDSLCRTFFVDILKVQFSVVDKCS
jgi:hypothetical protein